MIRGWEFSGDTPDLIETIRKAKATVLIGLSGRPGAFDEAIVRQMADNHKWPIIFPLSNPTSSAEAKPVDIFRWTEGQAIVATGSPFEPVKMGGVTHPIGQGNNAFIFPGLGFGAILSDASKITDAMVLEASQGSRRLQHREVRRWRLDLSARQRPSGNFDPGCDAGRPTSDRRRCGSSRQHPRRHRVIRERTLLAPNLPPFVRGHLE